MLPWFQNGQFPLYLAPMARVTDIVFRQFCKEQGADVMVTEFVQSDALIREDPKLWETVDFTEQQRPMGCKSSVPIQIPWPTRRGSWPIACNPTLLISISVAPQIA